MNGQQSVAVHFRSDFHALAGVYATVSTSAMEKRHFTNDDVSVGRKVFLAAIVGDSRSPDAFLWFSRRFSLTVPADFLLQSRRFVLVLLADARLFGSRQR